jgi:hypothetical protein
MNLKLFATTTSILTSILIVYFFFIIMKPNTNEKVVPTYLKNRLLHKEISDDTDTDDDIDPDLENAYINEVDRHLLNNITPLSNDTESCVPANQLKLENYKDLENINSEKEVYTNDAPLFMTNESKNEKAKPIDLNSQHRRVNFY